MRKLGEIVVKTRDKLLIVKSRLRDPRRVVGAIVYDRDLKRIGRVVDVIGRVNEPYVVIKPDNKDIVDYIEPGPVYYYIEKKPVQRTKRRGKASKAKRGRGRSKKK
jgi:RNA-binding protein